MELFRIKLRAADPYHIKYRGTGVQGYKSTGIQGYRGTGVQGYRGLSVHNNDEKRKRLSNKRIVWWKWEDRQIAKYDGGLKQKA